MRFLIESNNIDFNLDLIKFMSDYDNGDGITLTILNNCEMLPEFNMIYNAGYCAHNRGETRETCPFISSINPIEFEVWNRGYNRAAEVQKEIDNRSS